MPESTFEWSGSKAASNGLKHGISFENATKVFRDEHRLESVDQSDEHEDRFTTLGIVAGIELVVVYTMRAGAIRIITAREAARHEIFRYWRNRSL